MPWYYQGQQSSCLQLVHIALHMGLTKTFVSCAFDNLVALLLMTFVIKKKIEAFCVKNIENFSLCLFLGKKKEDKIVVYFIMLAPVVESRSK